MEWGEFQQPGAAYRIQPFWFWNGEMDDSQIERQIEEMADKGLGGFFVCARQGLTVPYLSHAWFAKVRVAVECAKRLGLEVWLYDEYPYPSGIAGGEVTLELPEAKHYTLTQHVERVQGGAALSLELPWARILSAKAVPIGGDGTKLWDQAVDVREMIGNYQADPIFQKAGLTAYNQKRFFTYRTIYKLVWDVPQGEWEISISMEKEIDDFKYYGTFVDPGNKKAMETFIRLTHEKYAEHFGEYFGTTIRGMFTDEIGYLGKIPWSPQLPAFFRERCGYELKDHLQALHDTDYPDAARIRYDFYQSAHELIVDCYHKPVHDWCEAHGLEYIAEVPAMRMTTQRFSHIPGGDSGHEKLGRSLDWILNRYAGSFRDNPKMATSIARQLGRTRILDECFHSVGWSMTLQDAKWMIDRMAAYGVNMFNFHAFFYTLDGMVKHDAPPSQFLQNPYWEHFRQLGDYTGRISQLMASGTADIRIAVLDPTTTLWRHLANPMHRFHYGGADGAEKERLARLMQDWNAISIHLLKQRRDYDHLDPEMLAEARIENHRLVIGHATYEALVLPPMTNLEAGAWKVIREFAAQGGAVIALGLLPHERIEEDSPEPGEVLALFGADAEHRAQYWAAAANADGAQAVVRRGAKRASWVPRQADLAATMQQLTELLEAVAPAPVRYATSEPCESVLLQVRQLAEGRYTAFVSQQEGELLSAELLVDAALLTGLDADATLAFRELDLETGEAYALTAERQGSGLWRVKLPLEPYQARLVEWTQPNEAQSASIAKSRPEAAPVTVSKQGEWQVQALSPNAVRFDHFRLSIGDITAQEGIPVKVKTFIDQCEDIAAEREFPVAFRQMFGTPLKLSMAYPLACTFRTQVQIDTLPESCSVFMDASAISGEWTLRINGHALTRSDFRSSEVYDYRNIACDVTSFLQTGVNELAVEVQVAHDWDGVVDALYLGGPFGVAFTDTTKPVITAAPATQPELPEVFCPGFPYYAGKLSYQRTLQVDERPTTPEFELRLADWTIHDEVEVRLNGQSLGVRPWAPYRWTGESSLLQAGDNTIEVIVTSSLIGLLEGNYFDDAEHKVKPVYERV
ncbi:glycosyl hydrolase [Paenibacillus cremeus]|uniref:Glycoside hydrolase n=1 Tax=Paenibacillus cremeus TaxID=2163881 RepID=A0A559K9W9_9BACL|nr:glycosyl hydrolase [Paenibacillus cremeus]TVY08912.1 hypothetical protein FPZ49_16720 [Paenibacillus cremeus]